METTLSPAALATFQVPVRPTVVPRNTVYRFRVLADRDIAEVVLRLIERGVELLEIRRCAEPRQAERRAAEPGDDAEAGGGGADVVVPFRAATGLPPAAGGPASSPRRLRSVPGGSDAAG